MQSLVCFALYYFALQTSALEDDFCERDSDNCDQYGNYKHISITSYEDFRIRQELDSDADLIKMRPNLALRKIEEKNEKTSQ